MHTRAFPVKCSRFLNPERLVDISDTPAKSNSKIRARLGLAAKTAVSIALIVYLLGQVDPRDIMARAARADWMLLTTALCAIGLVAPLMGIRWYLVMRSIGPHLPVRLTIPVCFIGLFFGQFLPASVGSDAVRGWFAYRYGIGVRDAVSGLLIDRIFGLFSFAVLILATASVIRRIATPEVSFAVLVAALAIVAGVVVALLLSHLPRGTVNRPKALAAIFDIFRSVRGGFWSADAAGALIVSLVIHIGYTASAVLIARSLGISIGYPESIAVIATVALLMNLPISFNGWGVREGAMVVGLGYLGIGAEDALTISVLLGLGLAVAVIPGLPIWILMRGNAGILPTRPPGDG